MPNRQLGGYVVGVFSNWADRKLIGGWQQALRLRVIQLHAGVTIIAGIVYNASKQFPELAQQVVTYLPPGMFNPLAVNAALVAWLLLGAYARLVNQAPKGGG